MFGRATAASAAGDALIDLPQRSPWGRSPKVSPGLNPTGFGANLVGVDPIIEFESIHDDCGARC